MDRLQKLELIQRTLGLRHKLKVHESMKAPETHEDLAISLLAKWELEDELKAIEALLNEARDENVQIKQDLVLEALDAGREVKYSTKTNGSKKKNSKKK